MATKLKYRVGQYAVIEMGGGRREIKLIVGLEEPDRYWILNEPKTESKIPTYQVGRDFGHDTYYSEKTKNAIDERFHFRNVLWLNYSLIVDAMDRPPSKKECPGCKVLKARQK